jgi:hypothetical protein
MVRPRPPNPWPDTQRTPRRDELLSPRTQIVVDPEAYLGQGQPDIGRRIADDRVELFVPGEAAQALQHEFIQHAPEFIALHDVGTRASLRLLGSLAGSAGGRLQRLAIRRQGTGVVLAELQFVEVPLADGTPLRLYSTAIDGDDATREQVGRVLLAHSRLGVLMVGTVPARALAAQLAPLRDALRLGPWPNRDLLLVPLGSSIGLAELATQLAGDSPVAVHVTPHASKPRQAWAFVGGAWNRMHGRPGGRHALPADLSRAGTRPPVPDRIAATEPMTLRPLTDLMRELPSAHGSLAPMPVPGATRWQDYVGRCAAIKGAVGACAFELHSLQPLACAGSAPAPDRLARQGALLLGAMSDAARALGLGGAPPEGTVSTATHHLLLRPVPGHPGVAVHVVVSAAEGNLALALRQLERIEPPP